MKKFLMLTVAAGVLAVPGLAIAQDRDFGQKGPVTRTELQKQLSERFAAIDTNKDGAVTQAEFNAYRETKKKQWADKRTERQGERFTAMDTDKNGQISKAEYDAANAARTQKWAEAKKDGGKDRAGSGGQHMRHGGKGMGGRGWGGGDLFAHADANKDGKVTLAEFSTQPLAMFDKADANKDGTVTPEERKAAWDKARAEWKDKRAAQKPQG